MADEPHHTEDTLLHRFVRLLEHRVSLQGMHAIARHDEEVVGVANELAQLLRRPLRMRLDEPPPRRVGVAMVLALHSTPHFSATFPSPFRGGTVSIGEPRRRSAEAPALFTNEMLHDALGVPGWEAEELREEIDRRAGKQLKLQRTVRWLWSHFQVDREGPLTLASVLLPGAPDERTDLVARGGHLYLLVEPPNPIPHQAMYLPWLSPDPEWAPTVAFQARSLDPTLKGRIARGIGADEEEVEELLEAMIATVPASRPEPFLHLDHWRSYGRAVLSDLGTPYGLGTWLTRRIPPSGADWRAWLRVDEHGELTLRSAAGRIFDALALPRVAAMMRLLYAAMLAQIDRDGHRHPDRVGPEDLVLFDLHRHLRAVLAPLLEWVGDAATHRELARVLEREEHEITAIMTGVRDAWLQQAATSWYGPPGTRTPSIQTLLLKHVICLHQSLRRLMRRNPYPHREHTDLLLQFCAHYLREARLERLWIPQLSDCVELDAGPLPPPEDIAGQWFWRAWNRLLEQLEVEPSLPTVPA